MFLYDLVRIRHAPTGFVAKAQVSGYEWDALTRRYSSITVGNVYYEAQCDYYERFIREHDEWEYAGLYSEM